jgi:hypothetical protein
MVLVAVVAVVLGIARPRTPNVPNLKDLLEGAENELCPYVAGRGEPPFDELASDGQYVNAHFFDAKGSLKDEYRKDLRRFVLEQEELYRRYSSRKRSKSGHPSPIHPPALHEP